MGGEHLLFIISVIFLELRDDIRDGRILVESEFDLHFSIED